VDKLGRKAIAESRIGYEIVHRPLRNLRGHGRRRVDRWWWVFDVFYGRQPRGGDLYPAAVRCVEDHAIAVPLNALGLKSHAIVEDGHIRSRGKQRERQRQKESSMSCKSH
jgi:hypothetical protein